MPDWNENVLSESGALATIRSISICALHPGSGGLDNRRNGQRAFGLGPG